GRPLLPRLAFDRDGGEPPRADFRLARNPVGSRARLGGGGPIGLDAGALGGEFGGERLDAVSLGERGAGGISRRLRLGKVGRKARRGCFQAVAAAGDPLLLALAVG